MVWVSGPEILTWNSPKHKMYTDWVATSVTLSRDCINQNINNSAELFSKLIGIKIDI